MFITFAIIFVTTIVIIIVVIIIYHFLFLRDSCYGSIKWF